MKLTESIAFKHNYNFLNKWIVTVGNALLKCFVKLLLFWRLEEDGYSASECSLNFGTKTNIINNSLFGLVWTMEPLQVYHQRICDHCGVPEIYNHRLGGT